jgi:EAL domain-containing protein (putative c-di-GMP-specific phosphodiesterase class I)
MSADTVKREFNEILRDRRLETVFQPIVELSTGHTVGYEALTRGPAGSPFTDATSLLDAAYRTGTVVEFDWVARVSACRAAMDAGMTTDRLLFLNVEPLALGSPCPPDLWPDIERAFRTFQVVLEVTERSLDRDPRSLLEGIDQQRPTVAGIAIDDIGVDTRALSMLPVLAPDVIKLDLTITQSGPSPATAKVLDIAYEEVERTGATILAEGVETRAHEDFVRSVGATLAQGYYYGKPGPLPHPAEASRRMVPIGTESIPDYRTPFEALEGWTIGRADQRLLAYLTHQAAYREVPLAEPALVLVLTPDPALLPAADRDRLVDLALRGVVTGALGPGIPNPPGEGVRGSSMPDDPLEGEWAVIALSPGTATALLARRLPAEGQYEFGVTHNRRRVVSAARCLLRRLGPP